MTSKERRELIAKNEARRYVINEEIVEIKQLLDKYANTACKYDHFNTEYINAVALAPNIDLHKTIIKRIKNLANI